MIIEKLEALYSSSSVSSLSEQKEQALSFLSECGLETIGFSHYGIVVRNDDKALSSLNTTADTKIIRAWVEAYHVHVARVTLEGTEVEFLQPDGESFFDEHLTQHGEGLQHVSVEVKDIAQCLLVLQEKGVVLVDKAPRKGSHGLVAFTRPSVLAPLYLELCQHI